MLDLVGNRKRWFLLSLILLIPGFVSLVFNGLDLGIDFTGVMGNRDQQSGDRGRCA